MGKTIRLLLLGVILVFISGCEYEFSEDSYRDIKQEEPVATFFLEEFENNITLYGPASVNYQYDGNNKHNLYQVNIYIDDVQIQSGGGESGDFYIESDQLEEGEHILKVEYVFSSGTGSLADLSGLEAFVKVDQYVFIIDKSAPEEVVLKNAVLKDGTIYISWEPITDTNFEQAHLVIKSEGFVIDEIYLSEEQLALQEYNDAKSLKHNLSYSIRLNNRYNESISNELSIDTQPIEITQEIVNQNQYKITWTDHPLYGNFDYYQYRIPIGDQEFQLSNRGGELIINNPPVFGVSVNHYFYQYKDGYSPAVISKELNFGKSFEKILCEEYIYSSVYDAFFALELAGDSYYQAPREVFIHKLDANDMSVINSQKITTIYDGYADLTIDPITNNLIVDFDQKSYLVNAADFSVIKEWDATDYMSNLDSVKTYYRNGIIIIEGIPNGSSVSIFNSDTKELIYSEPLNTNFGYFNVSDDGKYFYNDNGIYEINANVATLIKSTDTQNPVQQIEFMLDQGKCVYSNFFTNPVIYDLSSNVEESLTNVTGVKSLNYDQKTKKLLVQYDVNNKFFAFIYNTITQDAQELEIYNSFTNVFYRYQNDKLIFSRGEYLDYFFN